MISRFVTSIESADSFVTDANGYEMVTLVWQLCSGCGRVRRALQ